MGYTRRDVDLLGSGMDGNLLAARLQPDDPRRHVLAGHGGFPGVAGSAAAHGSGAPSRAAAGVMPIEQQLPGELRARMHKEGQHEHLDVPEDMSLIAAAGEGARTDRNPWIVICGAAQMVGVEAQGLLDVRLVRDPDIGVPPYLPPTRRMRRNVFIEGAPLQCAQVRESRRDRMPHIATRVHDHEPSEYELRTNAGWNAPLERVRTAAAQCRARSDGDAHL